MKNCKNPNCKQQNPQPFSEFYFRKETKDGYRYECKKCSEEERKIRNKKNPEKLKNQKNRWRKKYPETIKGQSLRQYWPGLNWKQALTEYNKLFEQQAGLCKICRLPEAETFKGKIKDLAVDHCHETGKVRGLLCGSCNKMIGLAKDKTILLENAIKYLSNNNSMYKG